MRQEISTSFGKGRFIVERELGRGGMGVVYEAYDKEREMRVALKTLLHMDADNLYYFKREFRSLHDIVHPNLCSFMELIQDDNTWFLTMELVNGAHFKDHVTPPYSCFSEERLRKCLAGLCAGLDALHAAGKVHRDIKPSNVLVTEEDRVVILDFGLIAESGKLRGSKLGYLLGSPAYMAPEQVEGEIVTSEADMYSVGVILYELLAGTLPFVGPSLKMILDKQLSDPVKPSTIRGGVPEDLEVLSMDLLSRDPKERPSASRVLDIMEYKRPDTILSIIPQMNAHTVDSIFVGRQAELQLLRDTYRETVVENAFRAVVVEGVSGVGKSALIENFTTKLLSANPSIVLLRGRCYERESAPFKAFDGIVESLINHIRRVSTDEAVELLPRNADLLIRQFPALKRLELFAEIPYKEIEIEDAHELQHRSFDALKEVLSRLRGQHLLVLVIDDIQWIDADSLSLLKRLLSDSKTPPMFLILLSRFAKEEGESVFDWDSVIPKEHKRIHLGALDRKDSEELARLYLNRENASIEVDAESIAAEAAGHPLYLAQLVQHIASGGKDLKNARIDEVIWSRVKTLPQEARRLLRTICVVGEPIESGHLQNLMKIDSKNFVSNIALLRANELIRSQGPRKDHIIESYHDRVREAVVAHDLSVGDLTKIHLNIGRFFLSIYQGAELEENIFFIVQHLYSGSDHITEKKERLRLAELLFLAGTKARGSAAFVSSLVYFKESIELFSQRSWETHYGTLFALYCAAAESALITGDFSLTKDLVREAKEHAKSNLDLAKIYETYVLSLDADGKPQEAIDVAIGMLRKFGVKLPLRPSKFYVLMKILDTKLRLHGKTKDQLINLPHNNDENVISVVRLMGTIGSIVYLHRPYLFAIILLKGLEISLKYGIDNTTIISLMAWGFINCTFLKNYQEGYKYGKVSLDLLPLFEKTNKTALILFVWAALIQHCKRHIRDTLPFILESYETAIKTGALSYIGYSGAFYWNYSFYCGEYLPGVAEKLVLHSKIIEQKRQEFSYNYNRIYHQTILNLMGQSKEPTNLEGTSYKENEMVRHFIAKDYKSNLYSNYSCKLFVSLYFNSRLGAYMAALEAAKYSKNALGTYSLSVLPFYDSLACLKYHFEASPRTKRQLLRRVRKNQRKYKKVARACPANHANKYTLVEAERARVKRKYKKAPALYDQAIAEAIEQEFTQDAALACEFAADFYREIDDETKTMAYAKDALGHYEKWGAFAKVEHVKEKFGIK